MRLSRAPPPGRRARPRLADGSPEKEPRRRACNVWTPRAVGGTTGRTLLVVDDPEALVQQALEAGASETSPVAIEHGWQLGRISDPFGHEWEIGKPVVAWPPQ
jgi:uncharacterized glyoxalase superfamily protein PhnB